MKINAKKLVEANHAASEYYRNLLIKPSSAWISSADIVTLLESIRHACLANDWKKATETVCDGEFRRALVRWGEHRQIVSIYFAILTHESIETTADQKAQIRNMLGIAYRNLGFFDKAVETLSSALPPHVFPSEAWQGIVMGNLSLALIDQGKFDDAAQHAEKARVLAHNVNDRRGEAYALGNLGIARLHLKQYEEARKCLLDDINCCGSAEDGNREGAAHAYGILGQVETATGNLHRASEYLSRCLMTFRELGNRYRERQFLLELVKVLQTQGECYSAYICVSRCSILGIEEEGQISEQLRLLIEELTEQMRATRMQERLVKGKKEIDLRLDSLLMKLSNDQ